jgi:hypothetical protein
MKKILTTNRFPSLLTALTTFLAFTASTTFAQYTGTNDTDLVEDAANWTSNELPNSGNGFSTSSRGIINGTGQIGEIGTITGLFIEHQSGNIDSLGTSSTFEGSDYLLNGGEMGDGAFRNFNTLNLNNSSTLTLQSGFLRMNGGRNVGVNTNSLFDVTSTSTATVNLGRDLTAAGTGTVRLSGSTVNISEDLRAVNGGTVIVNGGTVIVDEAIGGNGSGGGGGNLAFDGGQTTGARLSFQGGTNMTFGGSTAGTLTAADWGSGNGTNNGDRQRDESIDIDFLAGSQMSLTLESTARALDFNDGNGPVSTAWAQALWETDRLFYDGDDFTTLGLDWATVTSTGFGDGNYFDFTADGFGGTLLVAPVPEPSTTLLLFGGLAGLALLRRKRQ